MSQLNKYSIYYNFQNLTTEFGLPLYALKFYSKPDFRIAFLKSQPLNKFVYEEVFEIEPILQRVMSWNYQTYEYDVLLMTHGHQIFLHDFGPQEVEKDIELCAEKEGEEAREEAGGEAGEEAGGEEGKSSRLERREGIAGFREGLVRQNGREGLEILLLGQEGYMDGNYKGYIRTL